MVCQTSQQPKPPSMFAIGRRWRTLRAAIAKTQGEIALDLDIAVDPAWLLLGDPPRPMLIAAPAEGV